MTEPSTTPTSPESPRVRRRLPPHLTWGPDDEDDADEDEGDAQDGNGGEGEHQDEEAPPQAAQSLGEFLVEAWLDESSGLRRACERLAPDHLRARLRDRDLRDVSARSKLPLPLLRKFAAGGPLSDASLALLVTTLDRPAPRRQKLRRWLDTGRLAVDTVAVVVGCDVKDVPAIADGKVAVSRSAWRELERLVGGSQC